MSDQPPPDYEYQGFSADPLASSQPAPRISIINPKNLGEVTDELNYDTIHDLAAIISTEHWAPGIFSTRKRQISNLTRIQLCVLDVDDGCTLDRAKVEFEPFRHIIATSRSHQKEKNGVVCDRFRVVLFLDSEVTNDQDFKATWETAAKRWSFIDKACKDSSRFFYPSPEIISINETGRPYPVSIHQPSDIRISDTKIQSSNLHTGISSDGSPVKGELFKATYKFLVEGAPAGTRHNALRDATLDMREQGYTQDEVIEKLSDMVSGGGDWTSSVTKTDLRTIQACFNRGTKYPLRPQETEKIESAVIVNANELLDETFEYLADKDKVKGEPTGIDGLDAMLGGGFRTGELTVLMAQAKTGKNTLYHYLMYKHLERGIPFGYASRELNPATEVIPNLLSIAHQTNAWNQDINMDYQARARATISQWELFFAPGYGYFPVDQIETWFKTLKEHGVNHFLFDHFHYSLQGEDYEATAKLIKELKMLTKQLDIHLSLIVQPRSLREGEPLSLATLRGGAAIGQALDNLLILERVKGERNISRLKLEVARHKLAKLGEIFLQYDSGTTAFTEVERSLIVEEPQPSHIPKGMQGRPWPRVSN